MDPNLQKVLTGEGGGATAKASEEGISSANEEGGDQALVPNLTNKDQAEASLIWVFHLLMALAGSYMAMAITNWGSADGVPDAQADVTVGKESMWLKIVAQWITMILYLWSLWAPYMRGETEDY